VQGDDYHLIERCQQASPVKLARCHDLGATTGTSTALLHAHSSDGQAVNQRRWIIDTRSAEQELK